MVAPACCEQAGARQPEGCRGASTWHKSRRVPFVARKPSPWYWPERNGWYTILNGQRHPLGTHPTNAPPPQRRKGQWVAPPQIQQAFHALLAKPSEMPLAPKAALVNGPVGLAVA